MSEQVIEQETETTALTLVNQSALIKVASYEDRDKATSIGVELKNLVKVIEDKYKPRIKEAYSLHRGLKSDCDEFVSPLKHAMDNIRKEIIKFNQGEERKRLEKEAEQKRLAFIEAEKERKKLEDEALAAAEQGDNETFEEKIIEKEEVRREDHMPVSAPTPKMKGGSSQRANWQTEVNDLMKLVKAVAAGDQPIEYLTANTKALSQIGKATKGAMKIPGVKFYDKGTVSFRG